MKNILGRLEALEARARPAPGVIVWFRRDDGTIELNSVPYPNEKAARAAIPEGTVTIIIDDL